MATFEINNYLFDTENDNYKYNFDFVKANKAMKNFFVFESDGIDGQDGLPIFKIDDTNIKLDVSRNAVLIDNNDINKNDDVFAIFEVTFDEPTDINYDTIKTNLVNLGKTQTEADTIVIDMRTSNTYTNYIDELVTLMTNENTLGYQTLHGFKTSRGGNLLFAKSEAYTGTVDVTSAMKTTLGNVGTDAIADLDIESSYLNLQENEWNFYKCAYGDFKVYTKWKCVKDLHSSANNYLGEYDISVEYENGDTVTIMDNETNQYGNNYVDRTSLSFTGKNINDTYNYHIRLTDNSVFSRTITFGTISETEDEIQPITVTVTNGMLQMEGVFLGMTAGGAVATGDRRTVYSYIYDTDENHTITGPVRAYVMNPLNKSFILPNENLAGKITTHATTFAVLIDGRPLYQHKDDGVNDALGTGFFKVFRAYDEDGVLIPPLDGTEQAASAGDPYIQPYVGNLVKLPNFPAAYCLYYCPEFYITASVAKISEEKKKQIEEFDRKYGENYANDQIITEGYLYRHFLLCMGGETILVELEDSEIVCSKNWKNVFNMEKKYTTSNMRIFKDVKCTEYIFKFNTKSKGDVECAVQWYDNPQIDSGIRVKMDYGFLDGVGLLARNYRPKLMQIPKIHKFNPKKLYKNVKNSESPYVERVIYEKDEVWRTKSSKFGGN